MQGIDALPKNPVSSLKHRRRQTEFDKQRLFFNQLMDNVNISMLFDK